MSAFLDKGQADRQTIELLYETDRQTLLTWHVLQEEGMHKKFESITNGKERMDSPKRCNFFKGGEKNSLVPQVLETVRVLGAKRVCGFLVKYRLSSCQCNHHHLLG